MIEVFPNVYQGSDKDVDVFLEQYPDGWIIHAAKEPWHRIAVGYTGKSAPKDHPNYLYHMQGNNRMYLNFVDAPSSKYIAKEMVDRALGFALRAVDHGHPLLIHCNQGKSRSVMLCGLLSLWLDPVEELSPFNGLGRGCAEFYRNHYWGYAKLSLEGDKP